MNKRYALACSVTTALILTILYGLYKFLMWDSLVVKITIAILLFAIKWVFLLIGALFLIAILAPTLGWLIRFIIWSVAYTFHPKAKLSFPKWDMSCWTNLWEAMGEI